jgi:UDP-2,4-diacetamido-2,4,6-trideoxy-beta-L-altropyranose hydrolase
MRSFTVAFRADASIDIGNGHVMRCLALAEALQAHGARCCFVCRPHPGHLLAHIEARGHSVLALEQTPPMRPTGVGHASWLGAEQLDDAHETAAALARLAVDWLVVDHYAVDTSWERCVRAALDCRVLAIDDLADRPHDCDVLLDQNLGKTLGDYADLVEPACLRLIGPRHALLRPQFAQWRAESLARRAHPALRHVLVAMGGVDKDNATTIALNALSACRWGSGMRISVVMGPHAPWLDAVRECAARMPVRTDVLTNVDNMAELMTAADLAIGAAGSSSWERCALGLPAIVVAQADNQIAIARALEAAGASIATRVDELPAVIARDLADLSSPAMDLERMSHAARGVTDGLGASIVASVMKDGIADGHHVSV